MYKLLVILFKERTTFTDNKSSIADNSEQQMSAINISSALLQVQT